MRAMCGSGSPLCALPLPVLASSLTLVLSSDRGHGLGVTSSSRNRSVSAVRGLGSVGGMGHRRLFKGQKNSDGVVVVGRERGRYGSSGDGLGCLLGDQEVPQLKRQLLRVTVMRCGG